MSSDPILRERVKNLLQNVINQRIYGKGLGYGGECHAGNGLGYGGDMYDGLYGNSLVGGYPVGGYPVGGVQVGGKSKSNAGKKAAKNSCWINFVKNYASAHNVTYKEALQLAKVPYRKQYGGLANLY